MGPYDLPVTDDLAWERMVEAAHAKLRSETPPGHWVAPEAVIEKLLRAALLTRAQLSDG